MNNWFNHCESIVLRAQSIELKHLSIQIFFEHLCSVIRINRWKDVFFLLLSAKFYWKRQIYKQIIIPPYNKLYKDMWIQWFETQKRGAFLWVCVCCYFSPLLASLSRSFTRWRQNKKSLAYASGGITQEWGLHHIENEWSDHYISIITCVELWLFLAHC